MTTSEFVSIQQAERAARAATGEYNALHDNGANDENMENADDPGDLAYELTKLKTTVYTLMKIATAALVIVVAVGGWYAGTVNSLIEGRTRNADAIDSVKNGFSEFKIDEKSLDSHNTTIIDALAKRQAVETAQMEALDRSLTEFKAYMDGRRLSNEQENAKQNEEIRKLLLDLNEVKVKTDIHIAGDEQRFERYFQYLNPHAGDRPQ